MRYEGVDCAGNFSLLIETWESIRNLCQTQGLHAWLVSEKGNILAGGARQVPFCAYLQGSPQAKARCARHYRTCCKRLKSAGAEGELVVSKCHAGLSSLCFPLAVDGRSPAVALMAGGVLSRRRDARGAVRHARSLGLPAQEYLEALKGCPTLAAPDRLEEIKSRILPLVREFKQRLSNQADSLQNSHSLVFQSSLKQMLRDDLTGLRNKQYLYYRLRQELPRFRRLDCPLCALAVRLESLELINKRQGHLAGDLLLQRFARLLSEMGRGMDIAIRYEGNIFVLLLFNSSQQQGVQTAHRLLKLSRSKVSARLRLRIGIFSCDSAHRQPEVFARCVQESLAQARDTRIGVLPLPILRPAGRKRRRVVITGVGVVSPLGCDKESFRRGLYEGRNGVEKITRFDCSGLDSQIAGQVKDFQPERYLSFNKELLSMGNSVQYAAVAALQAVEDARLVLDRNDRNKVAVFIGSGVSSLEFAEKEHASFLTSWGENGISSLLAIAVFGGAISSEVSIALEAKGRSITVSTGCAGGTDAIGFGLQEILSGEAEVVIAGGAEAPISPIIIGSFCAINAISTRNSAPGEASRPFDRKRDGFVIAEGAGMVILEELQHALSRGAHIYGELLAYAATDDAYHMTHSSPDCEAAGAALRQCLQKAGLSPADVDYINAHGSSTPLNDLIETKMLKKVFGRHIYKIPISSTKSMLGHSIGASGALELIACLLGIKHDFIPPTVNYEFPDPSCDLDYVPNQARDWPVNIVVSNSHGFGGKNASIIVSRY